MISKTKIQKLIKEKVIVLDGAMGTELHKRGMPSGVCPEAWCLKNQDVLSAVHTDYKNAGSEILYTCTFGANKQKLHQYRLASAYETNRKLAQVTRKVAGKKILVAGDIGPTGKFIQPFGDLAFEEAVAIFKEQIRGLIDGGVDLLVIETMIDIQEARAALIAAKECADIFTMVTMTFEKDGRTLNGTDPVTALITLQSLGADAVGCNCSTGPEAMIYFISAMKRYATIPLVAKPNAGMPKLVDGKTTFDMDAQTFALFGDEFIRQGVNCIGGCCGTTPRHIAALSEVVARKKPQLPKLSSIAALTSAKKTVFIARREFPILIGEKINPTGKKVFQQELLDNKFSYIRQVAKDQENEGAELLDVNVGMPHVDEKKKMQEAISMLATISDLPLVIDSSNPLVTEAVLRLYPGRALINSISGDPQKIKRLLAIAKKYGAMIIILPLTGKTLAVHAKKRCTTIQQLVNRAQRAGFSKDDIVIDILALTVSSHPDAAQEALKTLAWCKKVLKCSTVVGLSNISFGLPQRKWINAAFLSLAKKQGLTLAIADPVLKRIVLSPAKEEAHSLVMADKVLTQKDKGAAHYIRHFASLVQTTSKSKVQLHNVSLDEKIAQAIIEGNREEVIPLLKLALAQKKEAVTLVNSIMIPAITKVGDLFDQKKYFLPQLIASAETMKKGFDFLEPLLSKEGKKIGPKMIILLATVEGDIHDIGKNIVSLMLKNHGFSVIDLGKDVSATHIISAIQKHKPALVGLSALMTTTMVNMEKVITLAKKKGLKTKFIAGGAVLTQRYAEAIGAHYAHDGVEAVKLAKRLSSVKHSI